MIRTIAYGLGEKIKSSEKGAIIILNGERYQLVTTDCCSVFYLPSILAYGIIEQGTMPKEVRKTEFFGIHFVKEGEDFLMPRYTLLIGETEIYVDLLEEGDGAKNPIRAGTIQRFGDSIEVAYEEKTLDEPQKFAIIDSKAGRTYLYEIRRTPFEGEVPVRFMDMNTEVAVERLELSA